jgi:hypothetical protein
MSRPVEAAAVVAQSRLLNGTEPSGIVRRMTMGERQLLVSLTTSRFCGGISSF